jgi:hypothetical protein
MLPIRPIGPLSPIPKMACRFTPYLLVGVQPTRPRHMYTSAEVIYRFPRPAPVERARLGHSNVPKQNQPTFAENHPP